MFLLLLAVIKVINKKEQKIVDFPTYANEKSLSGPLSKRYKQVMLKLYVYTLKVPLLRSYLARIQRRIAGVNLYNEFELRVHAITATVTIMITLGLGIVILYALNPDLSYLIILVLTAVVLNNLFVEAYITRLEKKLLLQMVNYFTEVRHAYHRHGIVEEALNEAAEVSEEEVAMHGFAIADALLAPKPEQELDKYYERAPNRFLKSFAGISYLVMEYGDKIKKEESVYLKAVSSLNQEIHLDILRRVKLDYLLRGLHVITLVPIFFTKPIEIWARNSFPLMEDYYLGKYGLLTKLFIYVIIIVAYILLQKLNNFEVSQTETKINRFLWEKKFFEILGVKLILKYLIPLPGTLSYQRIVDLIKATNQRLKPEWLYLRRYVLFISCFFISLAFALYLHASEKIRISAEIPRSSVVFGSLTPEEAAKNKQIAEQERIWINQMDRTDWSNMKYDQLADLVASNSKESLTQEDLKAAVSRITNKLNRLDHEYLKWWELLLALGIGYIGYSLPLWILYFQRKVRSLEMKQEVYQFQTMIAILREMERISVEEILEWMHAYAVNFREPIEKCLLNYEQGAEGALTEMKDEVALQEFKRLAEKLLLAVEKIPIYQAFDDLDGEMAFRFDQRRLDYDKMLESKANLGRIIGFTPMYALIFMYLVVPLIWMSFAQMSQYYEQIQKI